MMMRIMKILMTNHLVRSGSNIVLQTFCYKGKVFAMLEGKILLKWIVNQGQSYR
jgi:hypothetical protein